MRKERRKSEEHFKIDGLYERYRAKVAKHIHNQIEYVVMLSQIKINIENIQMKLRQMLTHI